MEFNPYDPEVHADPYPFYRDLRARDPVHRSSLGLWFVSRYDDAERVLRDERFGRNFDRFLETQIGEGPLRALFDAMMLYKDPPDHSRLRGLVAKAFTPRMIHRMRDMVQQVVDDLLDARVATGHLDVVRDLGYPLPVTVICRMLGIPEGETAMFRDWSRDLAAALDYVLTPDIVACANTAAAAATAYLRDMLAHRRRNPGDDLLSHLAQAEEAGNHLSEMEVIGTSMFLFGAGHETTTGLIGNGTLALLRHPDELDRLRRDPSLIDTAVEELLRFDTPVQMAGRVAKEPVVIRDREIAAGDVVVVLLGAANRDPARFAQPDRLDIGRTDNAPLSFGGGIHFCLGAPLARMEARLALGALVARFADLRLETQRPEWRDTVVLRGLATLPVAFTPSS